jgi:hypothetical protein
LWVELKFGGRVRKLIIPFLSTSLVKVASRNISWPITLLLTPLEKFEISLMS